MTKFFTENPGAVNALYAAVGAIITLLVSACSAHFWGYFAAKRNYALGTWDILLKRRVDAHEKLLGVASDLRVSQGLGGVDDEGKPRQTPIMLVSKGDFDKWQTRLGETMRDHAPWLTTDAVKEANYIHDYMDHLSLYLQLPDIKPTGEIGLHLQDDFVDHSNRLQKSVLRFFHRDIRKLQLTKIDAEVKYTEVECKALWLASFSRTTSLLAFLCYAR
jgi:hypothetical protein